MTLSEHERRVLREIELGLATEDPLLAEILSGPAESATTNTETGLPRYLVGGFVGVFLSLVAGGLCLADYGMVLGGCYVLMLMPPTIYLVTAAQRHRT